MPQTQTEDDSTLSRVKSWHRFYWRFILCHRWRRLCRGTEFTVSHFCQHVVERNMQRAYCTLHISWRTSILVVSRARTYCIRLLALICIRSKWIGIYFPSTPTELYKFHIHRTVEHVTQILVIILSNVITRASNSNQYLLNFRYDRPGVAKEAFINNNNSLMFCEKAK